MREISAIFYRELKAYFDSAIAYIFLVVFLIVNGGLYMSSFFLIGEADMRSFFGLIPIVLIVFIPAITMRLWAEEKRQGTMELLLTLPMNTTKIVLGKYLASLLFYLIALLCTWAIPLTLVLLGRPDFGPILGGYLGSILLGGFFLSVGIFISGVCKDQITAFIITMVLSFAFFMLGTDYLTAQLDGWTGFLALGTKLQDYVGMTRHFEGVERGIIDIKNIIYFLSMTIFFLILNTLVMEARMKRGIKVKITLWGMVMFAVVIFANVVASGFSGGRFDLTQDKLYIVSDSTKKVLSGLKVPLKVKLFITPQEKMPSAMKNLQRDILDKLEEFNLASNGKLTYEVYDPTSDSDLSEKIQKIGIRPFQVQSIEQDEIGVKVIYSAMSISYLDKKEEVIPAIHFRNLSNLEYELISKIYKLVLEKKPVIALFATEEEMDPRLMEFYLKQGKGIPQPEDNFKKIADLLRQEEYNVKKIKITKESPIPADADTLIIMNPKSLSERQLYEINRFVQKGKGVIFAYQEYQFNYTPSGRQGMQIQPQKINSNINTLLKQYGVGIDDKILMDNNHEVISIPSQQNIMGLFSATVNIPVKLPIHIKVLTENMNQDLSITNKISALLYLWGSSLNLDDPLLKEKGLISKILMKSSKDSWKIDYRGGGLNQNDIQPPKEFKGGQPLAVMLSGRFPDAYQGKAKPSWPDEAGSQDGQEERSSAESKIIVIGNAQMFSDSLLGAMSNAVFLLNAVDALSLGDELINIRSKSQTEREIAKVSPGMKLWYRFLVIFFMPLLIIVIGIIRFIIRKRAKEAYLRSLSAGGVYT